MLGEGSWKHWGLTLGGTRVVIVRRAMKLMVSDCHNRDTGIDQSIQTSKPDQDLARLTQSSRYVKVERSGRSCRL